MLREKLDLNAHGCVISVVSSIGVKSSFGKGEDERQPPVSSLCSFLSISCPSSSSSFPSPPNSLLLGLGNCHGLLRLCSEIVSGKEGPSLLVPSGLLLLINFLFPAASLLFLCVAVRCALEFCLPSVLVLLVQGAWLVVAMHGAVV